MADEEAVSSAEASGPRFGQAESREGEITGKEEFGATSGLSPCLSLRKA